MRKEIYMKITSVSVRVNEDNDSKMKAIASVVIDECFAINDIRIIEGENGLFAAMPSRKISNGSYKDVAHPITKECRQMFENAILEEYKKNI